MELVWGAAMGAGVALTLMSIFLADWWTRPGPLSSEFDYAMIPEDVRADLGGSEGLSLIDGATVLGAIEIGLLILAVSVFAAAYGRFATRKVPARAWLVSGTCALGLIVGVIATQVDPSGTQWTLGSAWIGMLFGWGLLLAALAGAHLSWESELEPAPEGSTS
jgi:hypothetical protein